MILGVLSLTRMTVDIFPVIDIPVVIVVFSVIQGRLEKRKHERLIAAKRRAANIDWRGGW